MNSPIAFLSKGKNYLNPNLELMVDEALDATSKEKLKLNLIKKLNNLISSELSVLVNLCNANFKNNHLSTKWYTIKNIRKVITGALEKKRADKIIGSSLEANIKVYLSDKLKKDISNVHLNEIAITSSFEVLSLSRRAELLDLPL